MLIGSVPSITPNIERRPLAAIAGQLPNLATVREGCPFRTRCPHVRQECATVPMQLDAPEQGHGSACPFV
jgi:oligopeptide/dipeptide ABC transporter ATP-binding protein